MMFDIHLADAIISQALAEDIGSGDITTLSTVDESMTITGSFIAKEAVILCGLPVVVRVFEKVDPSITLELHFSDGASVEKGTVIAGIRGPARGILLGERVALNLLQHMSGIASQTRRAVDSVAGTQARIVDTRKTTPGLRVLEKYAVRVGGGFNHRFNLSDGILIKDNHIKAAGGITKVIEGARRFAPHTLKIEVEVEDFAQVEEALAASADIIMLDNMSVENMTVAVKMINGRALVEASGNMGDKDLHQVALTGVDLISIGALTHSVRAADISLNFI